MSGSGRIDLASNSRRAHLDRDLAGARGHHRALRPDPVATVEALDVGEDVVSDGCLGHEQLDVGAAVGDGEEHELAGVALEHHPTGDGDGDVRLLAGAEGGADGTAPRLRCAFDRSGRGTAGAPDARSSST